MIADGTGDTPRVDDLGKVAAARPIRLDLAAADLYPDRGLRDLRSVESGDR